MGSWTGVWRLTYRLPLLLLHTFLGIPFAALFQFAPGRAFTIAGRPFSEVTLAWWSATACRIFGIERRVEGELVAGPVLVTANHIAWVDIQLLHSVGTMGFVAKAEIGRWPVIGWMAKVGQTVFHERGSHDSSSGVQAAMSERLAAGGRIAIFPEGGILPGPGVKRFHARLFGPAIDASAPVQPVMLRYSRRGIRLDDITFLEGEHFLSNFFRLLVQAPYTAEIRILPPLVSSRRPRRALAQEAEIAVRDAFASELPNG
jgi:1-acyl-sn-glycerol-3-phosphate acyltransferase